MHRAAMASPTRQPRGLACVPITHRASRPPPALGAASNRRGASSNASTLPIYSCGSRVAARSAASANVDILCLAKVVLGMNYRTRDGVCSTILYFCARQPQIETRPQIDRMRNVRGEKDLCVCCLVSAESLYLDLRRASWGIVKPHTVKPSESRKAVGTYSSSSLCALHPRGRAGQNIKD